MTTRDITLRTLLHTTLSVVLIIGYTGTADALDRQTALAPCNLSKGLAQPRAWQGHPDITVVLESLTRTPAMMTRLTWAYCNNSESAVEIDGWRDLGAVDQGAQIVKLVDAATGKVYSPVLLEGFAYGSLIPNRRTVMPGEAFTIWMNFPMIPMTIDNVDVQIDAAGLFKAIPIE